MQKAEGHGTAPSITRPVPPMTAIRRPADRSCVMVAGYHARTRGSTAVTTRGRPARRDLGSHVAPAGAGHGGGCSIAGDPTIRLEPGRGGVDSVRTAVHPKTT